MASERVRIWGGQENGDAQKLQIWVTVAKTTWKFMWPIFCDAEHGDHYNFFLYARLLGNFLRFLIIAIKKVEN